MAFPVTFSPPGTSYVPSAEDALRTGVMMMFMADDLTRKTYSYDADNPAKGVRIFAGPTPGTIEDQGERRMVLPQLLITCPFNLSRWKYLTSKGGEKTIVILVTHLEAPDTSYIQTDPAAIELTPEMRAARFEKVLQFGTVLSADQGSESAKVVHPYLSGTLEDGTYDPLAIRYMNELAPEMERRFARGQFAVAYSVAATYTVSVANRELPTEAGYP